MTTRAAIEMRKSEWNADYIDEMKQSNNNSVAIKLHTEQAG